MLALEVTVLGIAADQLAERVGGYSGEANIRTDSTLDINPAPPSMSMSMLVNLPVCIPTAPAAVVISMLGIP